MSKVFPLPNIGEVLESRLIAVGVKSPDQLLELGVEETFSRIFQVFPDSCINMLYGLAGATEGVKDSLLSKERKEELKIFHRKLKSGIKEMQ